MDGLVDLVFPNWFRGHAVMLSSFFTGNFYFIVLVAGFSAAMGLTAGIITAPVGLLTGAGTIYVIRKGAGLELDGLRNEAEVHGIDLPVLSEVESGSLVDVSKALYMDRTSWRAVLVSLAKFPVGIASLVFISLYIGSSLALITAPLTFNRIDLQMYGMIVDTPFELTAAVLIGLVVFVIGAHVTEKVSVLYLKIHSRML